MNSDKIYTSQEVLEMEDLYEIQEICSSYETVKYMMTADEVGWWKFVDGRYSIADYIWSNTVFDDNDNMILTIWPDDMSRALDEDCGGAGKAVCLADETALQRLIFWLYNESYDDCD